MSLLSHIINQGDSRYYIGQLRRVSSPHILMEYQKYWQILGNAKKYCVWICGQRLYCKDACKCEMRILKEQQLQEYVIEALKGSGMPVEDGYSDKIVRKYIKKVVIYEEYVLVDIFD